LTSDKLVYNFYLDFDSYFNYLLCYLTIERSRWVSLWFGPSVFWAR